MAALIWWLFKRFGNGRVAQSPLRWFWAIQLALVTHPVLDAFTVYGTQLWWRCARIRPWDPVSSSSTRGIRCGFCWAACWPGSAAPGPGRAVLGVALLLSSGYLGWGLIAKSQVDRAAQQSLAAMGLGDAPRFSVPMPFNTLLWRVVAMTPNGYVVGDRSLVADHGPMRFEGHASNVQALREAQAIRRCSS